MQKQTVLASLEAAKPLTARSPVTARIVSRLHERLSAGDTPLWTALGPHWETKNFATVREPALLLISGIHAEAIRKLGHPLASFFPTLRGKDGQLNGALDALIDGPTDGLIQNLKRPRAGYSPYWSLAWLRAASMYFSARRLPFFLAEVGTHGGLYAAADLLHPESRFDSSMIEARVGFSPRPLNLSDAADKSWLLASLWPDEAGPFDALSAEIDRYNALPEEERVQLVACENSAAPQALAANVPPDPKKGLLLLSMLPSLFTPPAELLKLRTAASSLLEAWGERALWLELDAVPGGRPGADFALNAAMMKSGKLTRRAIFTADMSGLKPFGAIDEAALALLA